MEIIEQLVTPVRAYNEIMVLKCAIRHSIITVLVHNSIQNKTLLNNLETIVFTGVFVNN